MATKKNAKRPSKVAKKKAAFKFRWWMVAILVGLIAIVGVVVIRYSQAGSFYSYTAYVEHGYCGDPNYCEYRFINKPGTWQARDGYSVRPNSDGTQTCANIYSQGHSNHGLKDANLGYGAPVTIDVQHNNSAGGCTFKSTPWNF